MNSAPAPAPAERLRELLEEVAAGLGLDAQVSVAEGEGTIEGRLEGGSLGLLIGRRGQTIDALQHVAQRTLFRGEADRLRVVVDADGYRARRAEALREEADRAAEEVLGNGRPVELEPMPASERRLVHEHLRDRGDVATHSEGEEPERFLVISPLDG